MIHVYNTLSKKKEVFETVTPGKVGMYLCGPTVYKPSHIGHMVGPVIFDTIKRYLAYNGYDVNFIINITDVDDKLIAESNKRGISMAEVAAEMTEDYMSNLAAMGVDSINRFPKATDHMADIISFTKDLVEKDIAYEAKGDVYFDVSKFAEYGKLSNRTLDSMEGEGGSTAGQKRNAQDFALWKSAKPGEPSWDSPWGPGRPGWHIECSSMSRELLGETFDIHGGGLDLIFPHHENEIAQSECLHGKPMARYWMHNGLLRRSDQVGKLGGRKTRDADAVEDIESQIVNKESKSTGASAFRDMLQEYSPELIRFFLLSTHYRRPIDYGDARIREVEKGLQSFYQCFKSFERVTGQSFYELDAPQTRDAGQLQPGNDALLTEVAKLRDQFLVSMDDDFNTGGAIGELFDLVRMLNKFIGDEKLEDAKSADPAKIESLKQATVVLRELCLTLGLFRTPIEDAAAAGGNNELTGKLLDLLVEVRTDARKNKDFAMSDKIRDSLAAIGVTLEDRPGGTEWTID